MHGARCRRPSRSALAGTGPKPKWKPRPSRRSGGASRGAASPCSAAAAASLPPRAPLPSAAAAGLFSDLYGPGRVPLSSGARSPIAAEPLGTAEFTLQSRRRAQPRAHAARRGPAERRGTAPARPRRRGRGEAGGGVRGALGEPLPPTPEPAWARGAALPSRPARGRAGGGGCEGVCPRRSPCHGGLSHVQPHTRSRLYVLAAGPANRSRPGSTRRLLPLPASRFLPLLFAGGRKQKVSGRPFSVPAEYTQAPSAAAGLTGASRAGAGWREGG